MRYNFFVEGMGIESDVICLGCVHLFVSKLSGNEHVFSLTYSGQQKKFIIDTDVDTEKKIEKIISKVLKQASYELNKEFKLSSICKEN
ncbi:MAG: hypothetical protein AB7E96_11055 [Deferribacterales bacterium]